MRKKNAKIVAKIMVARMIDELLTYGMPDSNCHECDESIKQELNKISESMMGKHIGSPIPYKQLVLYGQDSKDIKIKMSQGKINFIDDNAVQKISNDEYMEKYDPILENGEEYPRQFARMSDACEYVRANIDSNISLANRYIWSAVESKDCNDPYCVKSGFHLDGLIHYEVTNRQWRGESTITVDSKPEV